jgi:hypothetical protein
MVDESNQALALVGQAGTALVLGAMLERKKREGLAKVAEEDG